MRIGWNRSDIDYTDDNLGDRVVNGVSEIWSAVVRSAPGAPSSDVERVAERSAVSPAAVLEVQDFRGPKEKEGHLHRFAHQGGEVMGVERRRNRQRFRDELLEQSGVRGSRGVAPDGSYALVEQDLESAAIPGPLDIWRIRLDGSGDVERLTFFNRYRGGYYAPNPAVSPNGETIAFQLGSTDRSKAQDRDPAVRRRELEKAPES